MFSHPFSSTNTRARRIITGLALVAYVASVVGYAVPLPAAVPQDSAVPFPCQGHACGCQSAAQCWDNCCCYTPTERLAWVHKHGVTLPAQAMAALKAKAEQEANAPACKSCCHRGSDCEDTADSTAAETSGGIIWLSAIQAQKCQGLATLWITTGANLPLVIRPLWQFDWTPVASLVPTDVQHTSPFYQPPVPPPWPHV